MDFITKSGYTINIRLATIDDIHTIQQLNDKWTITSLEAVNTENGFLFCEKYDHNELEKIVTANEVAVAYYSDKLIGYYINDNYSNLIAKNERAIETSKQLGIIGKEVRVSKRTQIVVEKDFHRQGLPKAMLDFIKPFLVTKYELLFSIGRNDNPKRLAHEGAGWEVILENETNYYCIFRLTT